MKIIEQVSWIYRNLPLLWIRSVLGFIPTCEAPDPPWSTGGPWVVFLPKELEHNVFLRASRADVPDEEMGKLRRGRWAAGRRIRCVYCISMYLCILPFCKYRYIISLQMLYIIMFMPCSIIFHCYVRMWVCNRSALLVSLTVFTKKQEHQRCFCVC